MLSISGPIFFDMLGVWPVDPDGVAAAGGRPSDSRWADHRSSKFAAWPVVSGTGAPDASGARVLTSGRVTTGERSGVVLWEAIGAPEPSYGVGPCFWADATLQLITSAATANIADCSLIRRSSNSIGTETLLPLKCSDRDARRTAHPMVVVAVVQAIGAHMVAFGRSGFSNWLAMTC